MSCFQLLFHHRRLIWNLTLLDFKVRYVASRLGFAWMLLAPLIILSCYLLLFGWILRVRPAPELTGFDYGLIVACGLLPWLGFSEGVTGGTSSVLAQRNLMKSRLFPMELIPVTAVCSGLVGQLCGIAILVGVLSLYGSLGGGLVLLPVLVLLQAMFTIGLVWFLSCVNIVFRDLSQIVRLAIVVLMFVSPIAYTQAMVPGALQWVVKLNPLSYLIEGYREALLFNRAPDLWGLAIFGALAVFMLYAGHHYFIRLRKVLPDFV